LTPHLAWLDRKLVFHDTPLREAVAAISHRYGVTIHLSEVVLGDRTITASFSHRDTIDTVIDVLIRTLDLAVDHEDEAFILSASPST
ncbi:MAG: FecR domain-containing protein, partial [Bacteroidota bacterium]